MTPQNNAQRSALAGSLHERSLRTCLPSLRRPRDGHRHAESPQASCAYGSNPQILVVPEHRACQPSDHGNLRGFARRPAQRPSLTRDTVETPVHQKRDNNGLPWGGSGRTPARAQGGGSSRKRVVVRWRSSAATGPMVTGPVAGTAGLARGLPPITGRSSGFRHAGRDHRSPRAVPPRIRSRAARLPVRPPAIGRAWPYRMRRTHRDRARRQ